AVDAAVGAAAAIAAARPSRVIFVGTAGAHPPGPATPPPRGGGGGARQRRGTFGGTAGANPRGRAPAAIGTVAVASELHLVSTAALRGDGYLPDPIVTRAPVSAELVGKLAACGPARKPIPTLGVACP